jgi:hypothetical protein
MRSPLLPPPVCQDAKLKFADQFVILTVNVGLACTYTLAIDSHFCPSLYIPTPNHPVTFSYAKAIIHQKSLELVVNPPDTIATTLFQGNMISLLSEYGIQGLDCPKEYIHPIPGNNTLFQSVSIAFTYQ